MNSHSVRILAASAALALFAPFPSLAFSKAAQEPAADGRRSIEELLKEIEVERARSLEALRPSVEQIIGDIDLLRTPVRTSLSDARQRTLRALGPEAVPLMLPYLDPGDRPARGTVFRSELVAEVVADLASPIVTDDLLEMARAGSVIARLNALSVLERSPEPERVIAPLVAIARGKDTLGLDADQATSVREAAFVALASLGTPEAMSFIQSMLASPDVDRASAALLALENASVAVSADAVLSVLKTGASPGLAGAIATYYSGHPELLEDFDHARYMGEVAVDEAISNDTRIELFDLLRENDAKVGTPVKRRVDDYSESARSDVRHAALLLLARMKDRTARRELLAVYDAQIKASPNAMVAHSDRATLLHAIGDFSGATKDWREVMRIMKEARIQTRNKEPFIGIARSLARQKKFREAKEYLEKAPISLRERQALASERDFRAMVNSRYRSTFLLDE